MALGAIAGGLLGGVGLGALTGMFDGKDQPDLTTGSSQSSELKELNQEFEGLYRPMIDELSSQANSTKLIDDAKSGAAGLYQRNVGAANRISNRDGGMVSDRQKVLQNYQNRLGAAKAVDGSINNAISAQEQSNDAAKKGLFAMNKELLGQQIQSAQHAETLQNQLDIAQNNIEAQQDAANKGLFGSLAGAGIAAAALL